MVDPRKPRVPETNEATNALSDEQISEYREAFSLFDRNKDGMITAKEIGTVLRTLGQNPTETELRDLINSSDINKSGTLDFDEFVHMMSRRENKADEIRDMIDVFRVFDKDGDGYISTSELRQAMVTLGERMSRAEVDTIIKAADIDGDGRINYAEMVKMLAQR